MEVIVSKSEQNFPSQETSILIFGAGGHGKSVADLIRAVTGFKIAGFIDDGLPTGSLVLGIPVLGGSSQLKAFHEQGIPMAANGIGGIGNVDVRVRAFEKLEEAGFSLPTLAHPTAWIEPSARLEAGVQVMAFAYVGPDAQIGYGSLINTGACVSHDARLGKVVNLSPGATLAGNVTIQDYAQIGMQATVNLGLCVGKRAMIGNGATVIADVPEGVRVPAGAHWPFARMSTTEE